MKPAEFCLALDMPEEVTRQLLAMPREADEVLLERLGGAEASAAAEQLFARLRTQQNGLRVLGAMLEAAQRARRRYREQGIDDEIYWQTMRCFSRFVREYQRTYGEYGFDRWWWTWRQLSLRLFRLGALEYECVQGRDGAELSVHIPSDADLGVDSVQRSLHAAARFFDRFEGGRYRLAPYGCHSWLLSPALGQLLGPHSRILQFQALFELRHTDAADESYKQWLFGDARLRAEQFPEDTSLQRAAKAYILAGGSIGAGYGVLRSLPAALQEEQA